jgi:hypothetical protein
MRLANVNEAMYGKEPSALDTPLSVLLDYYSQAHSKEEKKKWFLEYYESPSSVKSGKLQYVASLPDSMFITAGTLARIYLRGLKTNEILTNLTQFEEQFVAEGKKVSAKNESEEDRKARLKEAAAKREIQLQIGEIDHQIDEFILNNYKSSFDPMKWLQGNKVPPTTMEKIRSRVLKLRDEILGSETDPELAEGYSHMTKRKKRDFVLFLEEIAACKVEKGKKPRKPRKAKAKSPAKLVQHLKYLKEFKDLKIQSIDPADIIGATSLWVYNVKYRTLTNYKSDTALSVKGSTLLNMSDESVGKKVRKPESLISQIPTMGKVPLKKVLDELKTTEIQPTGRINKDTIILRAIK